MSFPEPLEAAHMRHSPLIPKSPAPKEQPAASRDSGTRLNVSKLSAGHSGPGPPAGAVPQRPALGCSSRDSPAAPALPEPQLAGRCAVEARRGAPPASSPEGKRGAGGEAWAGGGGRESAGTRARAALRPAKVADPARGLAAEPRRSGPGRRGGGRGGSRGGASALRGTGRRAPLTQLGDVGLSFRPRSGRFGRRLPRPARCPSRCQQLAITGTTKSTRSPDSLKSTSSPQPLICIPEVAPRSPVRAPLRPPPPRNSLAGL